MNQMSWQDNFIILCLVISKNLKVALEKIIEK